MSCEASVYFIVRFQGTSNELSSASIKELTAFLKEERQMKEQIDMRHMHTVHAVHAQ